MQNLNLYEVFYTKLETVHISESIQPELQTILLTFLAPTIHSGGRLSVMLSMWTLCVQLCTGIMVLLLFGIFLCFTGIFTYQKLIIILLLWSAPIYTYMTR